MMDETQTLLGSNRYAVNLFCHQPPRRDAKQEAVWLAFLAAEFRRVAPRRHSAWAKTISACAMTARCCRR